MPNHKRGMRVQASAVSQVHQLSAKLGQSHGAQCSLLLRLRNRDTQPSIESFAPPVLHEVTEFYSKTKVHDRIKYRADQIKYWVDRCKTLAVDESKVHEKLPSHAKKLMRNKRFLLWQEMLQSCGYQDMGVVAEMQNGIHLTGETSRTNLWPEKFTPAAISCDELSEIGRRD